MRENRFKIAIKKIYYCKRIRVYNKTKKNLEKLKKVNLVSILLKILK